MIILDGSGSYDLDKYTLKIEGLYYVWELFNGKNWKIIREGIDLKTIKMKAPKRPGVYPCKLRVTDEYGASDEDTTYIIVEILTGKIERHLEERRTD